MADATTPEPLNTLTDEQLVLQYRSGNVEAFAMMVERYKQELFHFLLRFINDYQTADDLFQETFLQVHKSLDTFDATRRFRPWLFTIGANKARDHLRRTKKKTAIVVSSTRSSDEDGGGAYLDMLPADIALPQDQLLEQETQQLVQEVIASLPEHLREVLLLAYFQKFAYREIAEMLSIPIGTVKSRLHTAVGTFAQMWKQRFTESEE